MTTKSFTTDDGIKLTSASQRDYVTFGINADGSVDIYKRTDNQDMAVHNHSRAKNGWHRVVTVSFIDLGQGNHILNRQVFVRKAGQKGGAWHTVPCDTKTARY